MNRVVYFEVYVEEPEKIKKFYRNVFGWRFEKFEESSGEYWNIKTGPSDERGIDGGMMEWEEEWGEKPEGGSCVVMIDVEDLDRMVKKVEEHGGNLEMDKIEVPGVGTQAYCTDPAGNMFAIYEPYQGEEEERY